MTSDTRYAYQELRALCADLLATRDRVVRRQLRAAIARHLQSRCVRCGGLLSAAGRADPHAGLCFGCQSELDPPPPPGYPAHLDDGEVPF